MPIDGRQPDFSGTYHFSGIINGQPSYINDAGTCSLWFLDSYYDNINGMSNYINRLFLTESQFVDLNLQMWSGPAYYANDINGMYSIQQNPQIWTGNYFVQDEVIS